MQSITRLFVGVAAMALVAAGSTPAAAQNAFEGLDMAPDKIGGIEDMQDITKYCGTKPIKVAFSDGWGGNYWRQITRREFEDEAENAPNITEIRYTDGEFKAEKQIADIQGLIAQQFDVIIVFADTGVAQLKVMRQAAEAGIAVVPFTTGDAPFGEMGKDYLVRRHRAADRARADACRVDGEDPRRQGQRHCARRHAGQSNDRRAAGRLAGSLRSKSRHHGARRSGGQQLGPGAGAGGDGGGDRQYSTRSTASWPRPRARSAPSWRQAARFPPGPVRT